MEALAGLSPDEAEPLERVLAEVAARREAAGPERLYPADGYSRALLM